MMHVDNTLIDDRFSEFYIFMKLFSMCQTFYMKHQTACGYIFWDDEMMIAFGRQEFFEKLTSQFELEFEFQKDVEYLRSVLKKIEQMDEFKLYDL